jgi:hypothetical protein
MKNILLSIILLTFLSNCVNTKIVPITADNSASIKGKTIVITHDERPNFAAMTYKNIMISAFTGGIAGAILVTHDGNKIVKENEVEDPAIFIASNLTNDLKLKHNVKIINESAKKISDSVSEISNQYHKLADYVLDVRTINWSFGYLSFRINNFRVLYSSQLRLIDTKTAEVVAEGFCSSDSSIRDKNNIPTYEELLNDRAKLLKEKLNESAIECSKLFKEKVLNLSSNSIPSTKSIKIGIKPLED